MNKHDRMIERITKHGETLIETFGRPGDTDPVKMCKRLRQIEAKAHKWAEDQCNTYSQTDEEADKTRERFLDAVDRLLHFRDAGIPIVVNGDPRGYALKVDDAWMRAHPDCRIMRDWGGYGILAPDLTED